MVVKSANGTLLMILKDSRADSPKVVSGSTPHTGWQLYAQQPVVCAGHNNPWQRAKPSDDARLTVSCKRGNIPQIILQRTHCSKLITHNLASSEEPLCCFIRLRRNKFVQKKTRCCQHLYASFVTQHTRILSQKRHYLRLFVGVL